MDKNTEDGLKGIARGREKSPKWEVGGQTNKGEK